MKKALRNLLVYVLVLMFILSGVSPALAVYEDDGDGEGVAGVTSDTPSDERVMSSDDDDGCEDTDGGVGYIVGDDEDEGTVIIDTNDSEGEIMDSFEEGAIEENGFENFEVTMIDFEVFSTAVYNVGTEAALEEALLREESGRTIRLTNDINLHSWWPVHLNSRNRANFILDGNGFVITLNYNRTFSGNGNDQRYGAGLIGSITADGTVLITNLGIHANIDLTVRNNATGVSPNAQSNAFAGGIIGDINRSGANVTIRNSYVTGSIKTTAYSNKTDTGILPLGDPARAVSGGLIGDLRSGRVTIEGSYFIGDISSKADGDNFCDAHAYSGGLVGRFSGSNLTIRNSYAAGGTVNSRSDASALNVIGGSTADAGGLVGYGSASNISITNNTGFRSHAPGAVDASSFSGRARRNINTIGTERTQTQLYHSPPTGMVALSNMSINDGFPVHSMFHPIILNSGQNANVQIVHGQRWAVRFVPPNSGTFVFETVTGGGINPAAFSVPAGSIYHTQGTGTGYMFAATLTAGVPFTFWSGVRNDSALSGTYSIRVSSGWPPSFFANPTSITRFAGQSASFSVSPSGFPSVTLQWQHSTNNGLTWTNIPGETASTLTLSTVNTGMNGHRFRCIATNLLGSTVSHVAILTVNHAESIQFTQHPTPSFEIFQGQSVWLSVTVSGIPTPSLQWQQSFNNGVSWTNVNNATGSSLSLWNVSLDMNGRMYRCVATSVLGTATSNTSVLNVAPLTVPSFILHPADQEAAVGQNVTFTVSATGTPTPTYQWQVQLSTSSRWTNIVGATSNTLTLENVTSSMNGNHYRAVATTALSISEPSIAARLNVYILPEITSPDNTTVSGSGVFQVTATRGSESSPLEYAIENEPSGVSIDRLSGQITISATVPAGVYNFTITAQTSLHRSTSQDFTLTVTDSGTSVVSTEAELRNAVSSTGTGNVLLNESIGILTEELVIGRSLVLDLNGRSLTIDLASTVGNDSNGIKLGSGVMLTIMDSSADNGNLSVTNRATSASEGNGAAINTTDGVLIIQSGSIDAVGGNYGAGIGGGYEKPGGIITIEGGTINATGGGCAAAIGGGAISANTGCIITINGGMVNATGGTEGAGIGSGYQWVRFSWRESAHRIYINGGTINATGGQAGAGIGGGRELSGGNITISGGRVLATAGPATDFGTIGGASIGGGGNGAAGIINIIGGNITAISNSQGNSNVIGKGSGSEAGGTVNIAGVFNFWMTHFKDEPFESKISTGLFPAPYLANSFHVDLYSTATPYQELQLNCIASSGENVVKLTQNITGANAGTTQLTIGRDMTLDLNGYTLTIDIQSVLVNFSSGIKINPGVTMRIIDSAGGGQLNVSSRNINDGWAGTGAGIKSTYGTLIIESGSINATGGTQGAGIGGGNGGSGGIIIINGGKVNARTTGSGAGIGGGRGGIGGSITINDGEIDAAGGAGIGGSSGGIITINGGTINARGGMDSPGIGGSGAGGAGNITITGGTIVAAGGFGGAGIGSGRSTTTGAHGSLTISGGNITAIGGPNSGNNTTAAIGRGAQGAFVARNFPGVFDVWVSVENTDPGGNPERTPWFTITDAHRFVRMVEVPTSAKMPVITGQPQDQRVNIRQATSLSVAAGTDDGASLSYQWQIAQGASGGTFTDISGATSATFNVNTTIDGVNRYRVIVTNNNMTHGQPSALVISDVATVTVLPTFGLSLTQRSSGSTFTDVLVGYPSQLPRQVLITNTGYQPTGALSVTLSGGAASNFTIIPNSINNIDGGNGSTFQIWPNTGLPAGLYSETVTVRAAAGNNNPIPQQSFVISIRVKPVDVINCELTLRNAVSANGTGDVVLNANIGPLISQLTIQRSLVLDLNGYSLNINIPGTAGQTSNGITINTDVELTIMDSAGGGVLRVTNNNTGGSSTSANSGAAINTSAGSLIIQSGTVIATGGSEGAGIGSGFNRPGGNITINGGTVIAQGGSNAAGIGGGSRAPGGVTNINGGTVTATGGWGSVTSEFGNDGAGIGGGRSGYGGEINIRNGIVTARSGGGNAAGIGGGDRGSAGRISISGGVVSGTGGSGAGIGGGRYGAGGVISITGGTISAYANNRWNQGVSAIGSGNSDPGGSVSITGTYALWRCWDTMGIVEKTGSGTFTSNDSYTLIELIDTNFLTPYHELKLECAKVAGSGTITLMRDYIGDDMGTSQLTVARNLTLDLNGHKLSIDIPGTAGVTSNVININSGVELTIIDSTGGGTVEVISRANDAITGYGAAINSAKGSLVINSGTVIATGSNGAGIGGGVGNDGGSITINGGTVKASGGSGSGGTSRGAGIGGGSGGAGGTIKINGGTVDARGGWGASGIGGGGIGFGAVSGGAGGTIIINGGTVESIGGGFGAGIGGGSRGTSGSITIVGGNVTAIAGGDESCSNAIGHGHDVPLEFLLESETVFDVWKSTANSDPGGNPTRMTPLMITDEHRFVRIFKAITNAQTPIIDAQPHSADVFIGQSANLSVEASIDDGGTLNLQWQIAQGVSGGVFTNIVGATNATYYPDTSVYGVNRYRLVITNTNNDVNGNKIITVFSDVVTVTVSPIPTYGIRLDPDSDYTFSMATEGYGLPSALAVQVINEGNQPTGALSVELSGTDAYEFVLVTSSFSNIETGSRNAFTIRPKTDLPAGTYIATVTVRAASDNNNPITEQSFNVSFTVESAPAFIVSIIPDVNHTFLAAVVGYGTPPIHVVTIENDGNQETGNLAVELSGGGAAHFTLSSTLVNSIEVGNSRTVTIWPNTGLTPGTYTATVTVRAGSGNSNPITMQSFDVSFTVNPPPPVISINVNPVPVTNVAQGNISGSLNVAASVTQSATLSYQWFSNVTDSNVGGTAISGSTGASVTIPTGLTAGVYYFFVEVRAEGAVSVRSNVARLDVDPPPREITPNASINYTTEQLINLTAGNYSFNYGTPVTVTGTTHNIQADWMGQPLSIVRLGNGTTTIDSAAQELSIPSRPATVPDVTAIQPTAVNGTGGISGTTTAMEYRLGTNGGWTHCTSPNTTGLQPGTFQVRFRATAAAFASVPTSVTIINVTTVTELITLLLLSDNTDMDNPDSVKDTVEIIRGLNTRDVAAAKANPEVRDALEQLEEAHKNHNDITVRKEVHYIKAAVLGFDYNRIDSIGVGKNANEGVVTISLLPSHIYTAVNPRYGNAVRLRMTIAGEGVNAADLCVPITLTIPIPANIRNADNFRILHFHADGVTYNTIVPQINGSGANATATFTLTRFSEFAFVEIMPSTAPQNFNATAGNAQVALTWTAPANNGGEAITNYQVSRDNWVTWVAVSATSTAHTFTGLINGVTYTFRIRAVNAAGNGAEAIVTATPVTPSEPPGGSTPPNGSTPPPTGNQWNAPLPTNRFRDVPNNNWQNVAVSWADRNGITTGSPANSNTFKPNDTVTRAEFVTFLHRIYGSPGAARAPFRDLPANPAFQNAISWALAEGITTGSPAGSSTFMPSANITREQIAAMLYRYVGGGVPAPVDRLGGYTDEHRISTWAGAREAVNWAAYHGIMGRNVTELNPRGNATRAEAVTMLYRVVELFEIPAA